MQCLKLLNTHVLFYHSGGDHAMTMCTYAFMADIAPPEYRAMRMGLINLTIFVSLPVAMSLGSYIYEQGRIKNLNMSIDLL